jgi:hypothetical protein
VHLENSRFISPQIAINVSTSLSRHFVQADLSPSELESPSKSTTSIATFFFVFFDEHFFFFGGTLAFPSFDGRPFFFYVSTSSPLRAFAATRIASSS